MCDIYLVSDEGGLIGRPILIACIDACSGLCCGYSLTWEMEHTAFGDYAQCD